MHRTPFWRQIAYAVVVSCLSLPVACRSDGDSRTSVAANDYARAERFLRWNAPRYVLNSDILPHWIGTQDRFWYLRLNQRSDREFVIVNAATGRKALAFDHRKIALALGKAAGRRIEATQLPFTSFRFSQQGDRVEFEAFEKRWKCQLDVTICAEVDPRTAAESISPDGRWAAFVQDYNVWVRPTSGGKAFPLTTDGIEHHGYGAAPEDSLHRVTLIRHPKPSPPQVLWSPDSRYLLTQRLDDRWVNTLSLIQSVPEDGSVRPKLYSYPYAMPGDEHVTQLEPVVLDVTARQQVNIATKPLDCLAATLIERRNTWWSSDGKYVFYLNRDRFSKSVALEKADAATGTVKTIVREGSDTEVQLNSNNVLLYPEVRTLTNGDVIWYSERDGWAHLYYYNGDTGEMRNQITQGDWVARSIVRIDEGANRIYFMASGRESGADPSQQYLYQTQFDGTGLRLLTPENADHGLPYMAAESGIDPLASEEQRFSPSGRYFVDSYSRPDLPGRFVLRSAEGRLLEKLEEADISKLRVEGYTAIEPFQALAADGITPIYGNIFRPSNFDPSHKYPVIDSIYQGPQSIRAAKTFSGANFDVFRSGVGGLFIGSGTQSLAELGFIVVTIDGRGTPFRSRAFHNYSYQRMDKASDLEDHIAVIRQLAHRYPYIDLDRR